MKRSLGVGRIYPEVADGTIWIRQGDLAGEHVILRRLILMKQLRASGKRSTMTQANWLKSTRNSRWIKAIKKCRVRP